MEKGELKDIKGDLENILKTKKRAFVVRSGVHSAGHFFQYTIDIINSSQE